jgi:hypothetical protein
MKPFDKEQKKWIDGLLIERHELEHALCNKPKDASFDLTIYKHVYHVFFKGEYKFWSSWSDRKYDSKILVLDFLLDNDASLAQAEKIIVSQDFNNLKACRILSFHELEAY